MSSNEQFTSRWGLILATLGMAVGTGNIWRFPRIAASNGGGTFLVSWVVFLLLWSVPLMIVEFAFGKRSRMGTVGAFTRMAGPKFAWMGGWAALCAVCIGFYYSVVAGWCLRYLGASLTGELRGEGSASALWSSYAGSPAALVTHVMALGIAAAVVWFGVSGIEKVAKVLIPSLFVLVFILTIRAVTLPGAERGLEFLFHPNWGDLLHPRVWLEALTQNAWDTGAGWGLIVTYAIYMKAREDVPLNAALIGFGNNSMSLLAGMMVLCTVFAMDPGAEDRIVKAKNFGLTFEWMPRLFDQIPAGRLFMAFFFLALSFAAITSLIAMIELAARVLIDAGMKRRSALLWVAGATLVFGAPSALSLAVLENQDWVWGVGLMLSGLFFALGARKYGLERLRTEVVNAEGCDLKVGRWWTFVVGVLVPVEAVVLLIWWLWQAKKDAPNQWLNPISSYNVGTVLVQFAIALVALLAMNRWLARRSIAGHPEQGDEE
jgi:NSS family neurotransmitter:Na+ symporter